MNSPFTCVLDVKARLGESPIWNETSQFLCFVDIKGRKLGCFDPRTDALSQYSTYEDVGCIAKSKDGLVAAMRTGIFQMDARGTVLKKLADNPEDHAVSRFNDGRCDPQGRLWVGTIDEPKAGGNAHLYRLDERGLTDMGGGLMTSNGLAFSPCGRFMYHSDTPRFVIYRYPFDWETGELGEREVFVQLEPKGDDKGRPDGAAVDIEGCYWTALFEGARVQRYSPDGKLLAEYPIPAQCPTMVAFGGPDYRTIYVTSARDNRPAEELERYPQSGGVFSMRVETPGLPEPSFSALAD